MVQGRLRSTWAQTSLLAALIANTVRDEKKHPEPFVPAEFDPYADSPRPQKRGTPITADNIEILKVFVSGQTPQKGRRT
ncbi:MAG: hypothetical protein ABFD92_07865 [Planctomycetaceae bacterium]|nr:hypothetical protein [Planctomycetaceae bacterium]